jgi:hypothetical protein
VIWGRGPAAAGALLGAVVAAGCGFGPGGASGGDATLTVTRDYGEERLVDAKQADPPESETVIRFLDSEAEVTTRYGGGFVQSIDGIEGGERGGRAFDWFFYVNGIESPIGAAEARVYGGDAVWWDYRDWSDAMRVPAVVGSWPEPFLHGSEGKAFPVRVDCLGETDDCSAVASRLEDEGVAASISSERAKLGNELLRVVVGTWEQVRQDQAVAQIEQGPSRSGVFADFVPQLGGGYNLVGLDAGDREVLRVGAGSGLVAAVRLGDQQPTWVVTGTDEAGVDAAIELLDEDTLRDRYAVAVSRRGAEQALPVVSGG